MSTSRGPAMNATGPLLARPGTGVVTTRPCAMSILTVAPEASANRSQPPVTPRSGCPTLTMDGPAVSVATETLGAVVGGRRAPDVEETVGEGGCRSVAPIRLATAIPATP